VTQLKNRVIFLIITMNVLGKHYPIIKRELTLFRKVKIVIIRKELFLLIIVEIVTIQNGF